MQNLRINPGLLPETIHIPSSKSYANRALILSALKPGKMTLHHLPKASDVTFLIDGLRQIGLQIDCLSETAVISNSFPHCERSQGNEIFVGEGGTTARFLASLLSLGHAPYTLILGNRLKERPWNEFISTIKKLGGKSHLVENRLFIQGPVQFPETLEIDCSETTQFASGFQLASAFSNIVITPKNLVSSISYWNMTQEMVHYFKSKNEYDVPMDWSSASYPLVFGAIKQEINFPGLKPDVFQADSKLFDILKSINAIEETNNGIKTIPTQFQGDLELDAADCLDLVPALIFLLSHIPGKHKIKNLANLVFKESDRLTELMKLMKTFGRKFLQEGSALTIFGDKSSALDEVALTLPDDHRMVMTASLFLRSGQGGWVGPVRAVEKSYSHFFEFFD